MAPRRSRLAAACTTFSSVMPAPPSPFTSASRASGAAITSAKEPNFASSVLASGLTSQRGSARNNSNVVRQRVGAGFAEAAAQAFAMTVIMWRGVGKPAIALALLFQDETPDPNLTGRRTAPAPSSLTGLTIFAIGFATATSPVVQCRYGGLSSPFGDNVKISAPFSVTPTECSNCAESERSRVTAVQPSDKTF